MMKCDSCYDRTQAGKKPMCATVCPSQALAYTTHEHIAQARAGVAVNEWRFGGETVRTKVFVIVPRAEDRVEVGLVQLRARGGAPAAPHDDVAALLGDLPRDRLHAG
jgi:Fe-S-cluster-containing dehydrogenase component